MDTYTEYRQACDCEVGSGSPLEWSGDKMKCSVCGEVAEKRTVRLSTTKHGATYRLQGEAPDEAEQK